MDDCDRMGADRKALEGHKPEVEAADCSQAAGEEGVRMVGCDEDQGQSC